MKKSLKPIVISAPFYLIALFSLSACASKPIRREIPFQKRTWVELGPDSKVIARTVTQDSSCPMIRLDSEIKPMRQRGPESDHFPIRVCEAEIPPRTQVAKIEETPLPLPKFNPKKIVVIGDTGCRIKVDPHGSYIQACNNPDAWPFKKISNAIAAIQPDLVVHVGDYYYRESACPTGDPACQGSPYGDHWDTWDAEFFSPADTLLKVAPWVFIRGNHEDCHRGGDGWFRLLDPTEYSGKCEDYTKPYFIKTQRVTLAAHDSAIADDRQAREEQLKEYTSQFEQIKSMGSQPVWIFTHRPLWGVFNERTGEGKEPTLSFSNQTLRTASKGRLASGLQLIFAGHIHLFEALNFADIGPSQIVIGNGGSELDQVRPDLASVQVGDRTIRTSASSGEYGFLLLEPNQKSWKATLFGADGDPLKHCKIQGKTFVCQE